MSRRWYWLAGVAVLFSPQCSRDSRSVAIDQVLRAAPRTSRLNESRIVGLPWAQLQAGPRARPRPIDELQFEGVAGDVLRRADESPSAETLHAAGVANVLLGRVDDGVAQLGRAAQMALNDPRIWNDLAAARLAHATADPARLPAALAASDRALRMNPASPEAHYNRALALTRLGLRTEAVQAWREAAAREGDAGWGEEIERHAGELGEGPPPPLADELDPALLRANVDELTRIVQARVEDVRATSETIRVTNWADAVVHGDEVSAQRQLAQLRVLGSLIAQTNGDRFVEDVVRHIDAEPRQQLALAQVFVAYRDARMRYRSHDDGSDAGLRDVSARFAKLRSPMEHVARYYAANATYDRTRVDEARGMLARVLVDIDPRRYPSLAAGVQKQLGLCYGFSGLWTASLLHLDRAQRLFGRIREPVNAAFTDAILGEAYDRIGQVERGWRHRAAAIRVLSRATAADRLFSVVVGSVYAEIQRRDYESALSLLAIARGQAETLDEPLLIAPMMVLEARVLLVARSAEAARDALARTKRVAATIDDQGARLKIEADLRIMEGTLMRSSDPRRAIEIMMPAIDFYKANGFGILLPEAYLQRGRAYLAAGERQKALGDFRLGLEELERQRANAENEIRATIFDTVPELIAETVELLLADGAKAEAYAVVERARARTLIEALGVPRRVAGEAGIDDIAASLPGDALVVEYALLPHGVVAFCIRGGGGLSVVRLDVDRESLRRRVDELGVAIDARKPLPDVQRLAATLYDDLVAPLEAHLPGVETLYFVPDRFLYATPFVALFDSRRRQYLIEQYRVVIAPSGAFLLRLARSPRRREPALIVSDPAGNPGKWLPAARREASAIARFYPRSILLGGPDATIAHFVKAARQSALIHYAGHADADDAAGGFLPLAASRDDDGRLDATAISKLALHRTSLVILSACATMRGSTARVEGMPSISRAFLAAGAPAVLGMLWEIEDEEAARLLLAFHKELSIHHEPSAALRAAQRGLIADAQANLSHPTSWAFAELLGVD